jgi:hypothetical protein
MYDTTISTPPATVGSPEVSFIPPNLPRVTSEIAPDAKAAQRSALEEKARRYSQVHADGDEPDADTPGRRRSWLSRLLRRSS